ncbi:MAG: hypothetical protein L3J36_12235 [Rhodobacteraceae bacterium]|nr:hypothetical protein [Paracoccaceae bacterium]
MPEQIPDSILPKASAKQEAFITRYIDKNYKKKKAQKQAMLESAWLTYQSSRNTCSEIVDLVQSVSETKEDYDFVRDMRLKTSDAIAKIKPGSFKGLSDATKQIVAVAEDLVTLKMQALNYMRSQAQGGRDMTQEAAIKIIVGEARANLLQINAEFGAKAEELRGKVRKEAPNLSWDPVEMGQFAEVSKISSATLLAIPKTGDKASETSAKSEAAEAVKKAETARGELIASMTDYAESDNFTMFVADMRRRDAVVVALKEVRETLEQLDRWGVPEAAGIGTDADTIEKELDLVFADRSGLSASEADTAEKAQSALLGKAVALGDTATSAISRTQETFDSEIDKLRPQVERLEQRWQDCKKDVGKTQSAPIKAQIAAMRLSLDGLGGCNTDAIDAVKKMIKETTDLVLEAENIELLNERILSLLSDAKNEAKALIGKSNPIADVFAKHIGEIDEFKGGFKEKTLTDATKGAQELLEAVRVDVKRNQDLIDRRREIMERIAKREQQLVEFNLLFRQMLEHAGQTPKDYRGSFQADIETCKSWAATKTDPVFYDTIDAKLTSILTGLDKEAGNIRLLLSKSNQELLMEAATAATKHRDANLDLNQRDGKALAELAKAQAALAAIQKRLDAGEDVPESELKAANDALAAANKARGDIADERGVVQREYDEATVLLDQQTQLVKELAGAEAADELAQRKKDEFIEISKEWLAAVTKEVGDKATVLADYKDEADPQIERIKTARKMLKDDKPGVTGASALSELEFVKKFLDRLRERGKKTDRRNLGDIGVQWDKEVIKVNKSASDLITAIEEFEKFPQIEGKASGDVEKMFGVILGRMQDHAFEQAAKTFNDSDDKQIRKSAREQALSEVRRYRALMFNDPLLQKCVMNPFSVPVGSGAANRLDEIELNVLRGI